MVEIMRVDVDGTRLFFEVVGTKLVPDHDAMREQPTVLVLHGGPGADHSTFRPELDVLADVGQLVYVDHRGNGRSDRSEPGRWNLAQWADDVRALCAALELERPIVLGASFGGIVAMLYAIRFPDDPAGLILLSTTARMELDRTLDAFERLGGADAREVARRRHEEPDEESLAEYLRVCFPLYARKPTDPERMSRVVMRQDVRAHFAEGEQMRFDLTTSLSAIRCPVLVVAGEDDPMTPPENAEDIIAALAPALGRLERLPNAGHMLLHDAAEEVTDLARAFIVEREPGALGRSYTVPSAGL